MAVQVSVLRAIYDGTWVQVALQTGGRVGAWTENARVGHLMSTRGPARRIGSLLPQPAHVARPSTTRRHVPTGTCMYVHVRCSSRLASSGHCLIGKAQTNGCLDTGLMRATPLFHDALAPCFSRLGPDTHARRLGQTAVLAWPWTPRCFVAGTKPWDRGHVARRREHAVSMTDEPETRVGQGIRGQRNPNTLFEPQCSSRFARQPPGAQICPDEASQRGHDPGPAQRRVVVLGHQGTSSDEQAVPHVCQ